MTQIEQRATQLFATCGNILLAFIRQLAPFSVPFAPAFFFGHAIYVAAGRTVWAAIVGGVAALGLESAGILAAHYAVRYYVRRDGRWLVAAVGTVIYLVIGITVIWFLEAATNDAKWTATAMFLIAGVVYVLVGLAESERIESAEEEQAAVVQQAQEADALAWQREQDEKERDWQRRQQEAADARTHEERLRKLELDAQVRVARASAKATKVESAAETRPKVSEGAELSGKALEIFQLLSQKPGASNTEIGEIAGVSRQYVGQVRRSLNGQVK